MRKSISLQKRMISLMLAFVMAAGLIYIPAHAADDLEGRYQLTVSSDMTLSGAAVTDDAGISCELRELQKVSIISIEEEYPTLTISGNVNLENASIEAESGCGLKIGEGSALTAADVKAPVINYGTLRAASVDYADEGDLGITLENYGVIETDVMKTSIESGSFINVSGASITVRDTWQAADYVTVTNRGKISLKQFDFSTGCALVNEGELLFDQAEGTVFDTGNGVSYYNDGTIAADQIRLTLIENGTGSVYMPKKSITITGYNSERIGTVIAEPETEIEIDGGGFTLKVGDDLSGTVVGGDNGRAIELIGIEPEFTVSPPDTLYVGQSYDPADFVNAPSDYTGELEFEFCNAGLPEFYNSYLPDEAGDYMFRAYAPAAYPYKSGAVSDTEFTISYLPLEACKKAGASDYLALSGAQNDVYVQDSVTLTPAGGFSVLPGGEEEWMDSVTLTEEEIYPAALDGAFNEDITFSLKRSSDGARTAFYPAEELCGNLPKLVFDRKNPVIASALVDGKAASVADGDTVTAKNTVITVQDENLAKVVTSGKSYTRENGGVKKSGDQWIAELEFIAEKGPAAKCSITAYDLSGRTLGLSFNLEYLKNTPTASLSVADILVGEKPAPEFVSDSDGKVSFTYKAADADDSAFSAGIPSSAGNYVVRAEVPETDGFEAVSREAGFTISRRNATASISMPDGTLGVPAYYPSLSTSSDGDVTYQFKKAALPDESFSSAWPSEAGTYTVRAVISQTAVYEEVSCRTDFTLSYLEAPSVAYIMDGNTGENGYYTTSVTVRAPEGFTISEDGTVFRTSIPYRAGLGSIYLRREDGALTDAIPLPGNLKIDTVSPYISADGVNVQSVSLLFMDSLELLISDDKLAKVTVNGEDVKVENGRARVLLDPEKGTVDFVILAIDEAGNTQRISFSLSALWLKDRVIPAGVEIPLAGREEYLLGDGKWTVDNDPNVYSGNVPVYVDADGRHTFNKAK